MPPMVSVLIPIYNGERYIAKCIDSVLGQEYSEFEIIIVNDGSTDGSKDIIHHYMSKYPEKITYCEKENGGLSSARNHGLEYVHGKYVTFLDADDYIDSRYLLNLVEFAEANGSDMVCSGQHKVKENGEIIKTISYKSTNGNCLVRRLNISGKLYNVSYINRWGIRFPLGKTYEDNSFNLQAMFLSNNVYFINEYAGYYQVVHEGSITSKPIDVSTLPLEEWRECILKIQKNHETNVDMELFEFTVLSFFTYFLFVRNRKREYLSNTNEINSNGVEDIAMYFERVTNECFPRGASNEYVRVFKYRELALVQRVGVFVYAWMCRKNWLGAFVKLFYKLV